MTSTGQLETLYRHAAPTPEIRRLQGKHVCWFRHAPGPVLDLGCGRGLFLDLLRDACIEGFGVDASAAAAEVARSAGHAVEQAPALDFLDECVARGRRFGGVFCSHLIEHHAPPQAERLVQRVAEVLQPGSHAVFVTPNPQNFQVVCESFWLDPTHVRPYPRGLLVQLLEEAGLEVIAAGDDPDTRPTVAERGFLRYWLSRLTLGPWTISGLELFAVGRRAP